MTGTRMWLNILVEVVLILHMLWCVWVMLGWTITHRQRFLRTLHIASLIYAVGVQLIPWPLCPLTVAETRLEARAGIEPAHGPFLVRVLDAAVYPDLPERLVVGGAVLFCLTVLWLYLWRYRHRTVDCQW